MSEVRRRPERIDPPDPLSILWLAMAGVTVAFLGAFLVAVGVLPASAAVCALVVAVPGRFVAGYQDLRRTADAFVVFACAALAIRLIATMLTAVR